MGHLDGRRSRRCGSELSARLRQRPARDRGLGEDRPRRRARCSTGSSELYEKHARRIPTPELNRFLGELREARQPPSRGGKRLNLLYGTQVQTRPPRFRFFVNDPASSRATTATGSRTRLRKRFELQGVPVDIDFVRRA